MYRYIFLIILFHSILMEHHSVELFDRLHHLIEYVRNHTESQKPDLMLGFYLCEAQLKTMHLYENGPHNELKKVVENIKTVREQYENRVDEPSIWNSNVHNSIVVQHLLKLSFWVTSLQNNEFMFFGNLTTHYPLSITLENFAGLIDNGAPSPSESDECLAELLNSIDCTMSRRCLQIMSLDNESHGYHLTHKLLYFMLVKYRMCGQCLPANAMSLDFIIHTLCAMIWHERNLIIEMNIPNATKDLFLEQTLLCGLNGYITFIDENIAIKTVQWQVSESGCYEYFDGTLPTNNTEMRMTKRSADALQGNCSDHMTGLAAATFGLFAKLTEQFEEETF